MCILIPLLSRSEQSEKKKFKIKEINLVFSINGM